MPGCATQIKQLLASAVSKAGVLVCIFFAAFPPVGRARKAERPAHEGHLCVCIFVRRRLQRGGAELCAEGRASRPPQGPAGHADRGAPARAGRGGRGLWKRPEPRRKPRIARKKRGWQAASWCRVLWAEALFDEMAGEGEVARSAMQRRSLKGAKTEFAVVLCKRISCRQLHTCFGFNSIFQKNHVTSTWLDS